MNRFLHNRVAIRSKGWITAALFVALAGCSFGHLKGPQNAGFSGHELFDGKRAGNSVTGVVFAGTDNKACDCWTNDSTGGTWTASINYKGQGGLGSAVTVVGGSWSWLHADGTIQTGRITGGAVTWPAALDSNAMGCGKGGGALFHHAVAGGPIGWRQL
ncbi:hypothetical protein ACFS07_14650 [Undibacterium arcticum]